MILIPFQFEDSWAGQVADAGVFSSLTLQKDNRKPEGADGKKFSTCWVPSLLNNDVIVIQHVTSLALSQRRNTRNLYQDTS